MKTSIYIVSFLALPALVSCKKFLDVTPKESITSAQTIFDKASAEEALRGVYSALANADYYGTGFQSIAYLSGDNVQWTGSQSQIQEFINHKVSAENATISGAWTAIYRTINRANLVIHKVPAVTDPLLTTALKDQFIGEAYFIRALAYFDLARTWGGAPIITNPTVSYTDNYGIRRSTQTATYAQALADLNNAETLLKPTTERYRANQKTVWALKARYYLYQKDWANADAYASKLIEDPTSYKLVTPYNSFFAGNVRGTIESVFEIFYNGTTEVNTHRGQWQPQINGGTRQWAPSTGLLALVNNAATGGNRNTLVAKDNQNRWYGNLYYRSPASDPSYIIRIAELFLIRAEARAQLNNLTSAIEDLDAIRDRAGLAATTATTQADLLLAIENERRLEFAFEPHRWFDLVRTDRAKTVLNFTDANKYLMPLPSQQIQIDTALKQNDSY